MTEYAARPRVGVVKFASCDGCQLTLLGLEDQLLALCEQFDIVDFPEATSARCAGPYDLLLVEGSVSGPEHLHRIKELRAVTKVLVSIGACATAGGIQALRNVSDSAGWQAAIYPGRDDIEVLATSTPIASHVTVDYELRGCPIDPGQLVELLVAIKTGRRPQLRDESVCMECKRRGYVCTLVAKREPCLGQATQAGCGAICPRMGRGCYGCFGPRDQANVRSLAQHFHQSLGMPPEDVRRLLGHIHATTEAFKPWVIGEAALGASASAAGVKPQRKGTS
jgi:coenzyme F420-reducing hydrogenase gamma subunit